MIDQTIIDKVQELNENLNFNKLLEFMSDTGITYKNKRLKGPLGIATYDCVYLDLNNILRYSPNFLYFIILHETAHHKRMIAMGKSKLIELLSISEFNSFVEHVIEEEMIADRYGRYMFYKFNKISFPIDATQKLHEPYMRERYKPVARSLFGVIQNNENKYDQLIESFLYE